MLDQATRRDLDARYPGIVPPAFLTVPAYTRTLGPEVAAVCELASFGPDPEQQLVLDLTFGLDDRGRSAASEIVCICCRQNLKTGSIKQIELGWLFVTGERLVVHSAHEFNTSREAHRDMKELIEGSSILCKRVKAIKDTPADMSIELHPRPGERSGARLVFKTRTAGGGRGLSGRKVVLDEAFALKPAHMGALRPLISAQPDPQLVYASSACLTDSEVLRGVVGRGRPGTAPRLGYCEWCARTASEACRDGEACTHEYGVAVGCAMDNLDELRSANPAMGRRIEIQTILDERRAAVGPLVREFGRERMGWHDDPAEGLAKIDPKTWADRADCESELLGATALGFDVQPDNLSAAISAVGRLKLSPDVLAQALELGVTEMYAGPGRWRAEITGPGDDNLDARPGTDWLVPRLAEIAQRQKPIALVFNSDGPAGAFRQALLDYQHDPSDPRSTQFVEVGEDEQVPRGKTRLVALNGRNYAAACGALDADLRNDRFRHYDQSPLNDAAAGAHAQDVGDGAWKWSRKDSSVNIAPLVAATCARHGFAAFGNAKPKPTPWAASV